MVKKDIVVPSTSGQNMTKEKQFEQSAVSQQFRPFPQRLQKQKQNKQFNKCQTM